MAIEESGDKEVRTPYLEIEAPEFLAEGQNFYEQQPFNGIFQSISAEEEVDQIRLQSLLTAYLRGIADDYKFFSNSEQVAQAIKEKGNLDSLLRGIKVRVTEGLDDNFTRAFHKLGSRLDIYPLWFEYYRDFFDPHIFRGDGSFKEYKKDYTVGETRSYGSYASITQLHDEKIRSLAATVVANEAFPEGQYQTSPGGIKVGEKSENRKWRIFKASELIKPH